MDDHTYALHLIVQRTLRCYRPIAGNQIPAPVAPADTQVAVERVQIGDLALTIISDDEDDEPPAGPALRDVVPPLNAGVPLDDRTALWDSPEQCLSALTEVLGDSLPTPRVEWQPPSAPGAFARFVLQGLGAHRVERRADGRFVLQMDDLASLAVRPGMARYGGDALISADGHTEGIRFGDRLIEPNSAEWAHASFVFRTSTLVKVTVADHLGFTHFGLSNALALATRRWLAPTHPLRCLLKPFIFRTPAINHASLYTLIPRGALVHRASALQWSSLQALYRGVFQVPPLEPVDAYLRVKGMHPGELSAEQQLRSPFSVDGLAFQHALTDFLADAFDRSPALRGAFDGEHRRQTRAWLSGLGETLPIDLPNLGADTLQQLLSGILFVVSGLHSHVGHVAPYIRHPGFAAGRVLEGAVVSDRQNSMQMAIVVAATGLQVPVIAADLSTAMPDAGARDAADRLRLRMNALQNEIVQRNRARSQPYRAFLPGSMPCSVSR